MIEAEDYEACKELLEINPSMLAECMERAPEVRAFLGERWSDAEEAFAEVKLGFHRTEARLRIQMRVELFALARSQFRNDRALEEAASAAAKKLGNTYRKAEVRLDKPTTSDIEAHMIAHEDYVEAHLSMTGAEADARRLKILYDAAKSLCDMLSARGNLHNAELKARPLDVANARARLRAGSAFPSGPGDSIAPGDDESPF